MVNICVVCGRKYEKTSNISYHRLPSDNLLKTQWIQSMHLENFKLSSYTYICSQHFGENCFILSDTGRTRLIKGSLPNLFPAGNKPLQKVSLLQQTSSSKAVVDSSSSSDSDIPLSVVPVASHSRPGTSSTFKEWRSPECVNGQASVLNHPTSSLPGSSRDAILWDHTYTIGTKRKLEHSTVKESHKKFKPLHHTQELPLLQFSDAGLSAPQDIGTSSTVTASETEKIGSDSNETPQKRNIKKRKAPQNKSETDSSTITASEFEETLVSHTGLSKKRKVGTKRPLTATYTKKETQTAAIKLSAEPLIKRRKVVNKRYVGDWSSDATISPRKAKIRFKMAKQQIQTQLVKIRNLQQTKTRLRNTIYSMKSLLKYLRDNNFISAHAEGVIKAMQPDESGELIKEFLKGPKRAKYSPRLRAFALTLHFFSTKAYNYVRNKLNNTLPHPRTISKWYQTIDGSPGFTSEARRALAVKVQENEDKQQKTICNMVLDEIAIKRRVEWDGKKMYGYVNVGVDVDSDELAEAKDALVFMLVALNGNWKLPIGYFLLESLTASEKCNIVRKALEFVHPTGVTVTSLTFDGAPTNMSMIQELGVDFKNIKNTKTWFVHPLTNENIYVFPDPCHMLKLVRNCFSTYKELTNETGENINWQYIEELMKLQEEEGLQVATKLRKRHISWADQPMKVNLAAQTMSNSVSCALVALEYDFKKDKFKGAAATAEFLKNINDLFDIFNSKNKFCTVSLRRGLSGENKYNIFDTLGKIRNYLITLKVVNGSCPVLNCRRKTGFLGFLICIDSLKGFFEYFVVGKQYLSYILIYKLSQDHLELFFSALRNRLGMNNNPTAREFETAYKKLIVHTEVGPSESANVLALDTTSILHCSTVNANTLTQTRTGESSAYSDQTMPLTFLEEHEYLGSDAWHLTDLSVDIVAYIAGFIVKSLKKEVLCEKCLDILEGDEVLSKLQIRKTFGRLTKASEFTIAVCKEGEKTIRILKLQSRLMYQNIKTINAIIIKIIQNLPHKVFKSFEEHIFDDDIWNNHSIELPKLILRKYINIRLFHETKNLSDTKNIEKEIN